MEAQKITDAHNKCIEILNESDLTKTELVATLAQLLIYSGQAITSKSIDVRDIAFADLQKEYYANNQDNDIGIGLILNGASIMGTLNSINGDVTATKEIHNDNQVSTSTKIPQEDGSITS